jgi:hypothetical protein
VLTEPTVSDPEGNKPAEADNVEDVDVVSDVKDKDLPVIEVHEVSSSVPVSPLSPGDVSGEIASEKEISDVKEGVHASFSEPPSVEPDHFNAEVHRAIEEGPSLKSLDQYEKSIVNEAQPKDDVIAEAETQGFEQEGVLQEEALKESLLSSENGTCLYRYVLISQHKQKTQLGLNIRPPKQ